VERLRGKTVDIVFVGDSIMHFWEWKHPESWRRLTKGRTVLNLGYGGDRTENVIWRIQHGELDGYRAKNVVLMIGTNNNSSDATRPANVAKGVEAIVALIKAKQPGARLILHPVFPRGNSPRPTKHHAKARPRNDATNALLKDFASKRPEIMWIDFNDKLVDSSGWVPKRIMPDGIHPSDAGYDLWMNAILPIVDAKNR
jgi:beta-glucosidase